MFTICNIKANLKSLPFKRCTLDIKTLSRQFLSLWMMMIRQLLSISLYLYIPSRMRKHACMNIYWIIFILLHSQRDHFYSIHLKMFALRCHKFKSILYVISKSTRGKHFWAMWMLMNVCMNNNRIFLVAICAVWVGIF